MGLIPKDRTQYLEAAKALEQMRMNKRRKRIHLRILLLNYQRVMNKEKALTAGTVNAR